MPDLVRYFRRDSLPLTWVNDAIYFIKVGVGSFNLYVTGNDAVPYQIAAGPQGIPGPPGPMQIHVADTPPASPQVNDLWVNTT